MEGLGRVHVCAAFTCLFNPTSDEEQLQAGVRTQPAEFGACIFQSAASSDLETVAASSLRLRLQTHRSLELCCLRSSCRYQATHDIHALMISLINQHY